MNIPTLADGAGAASTGAAAAGAVARSLLSTYSFSLAHSFSEKFATRSFRESLLGPPSFFFSHRSSLSSKSLARRYYRSLRLACFVGLPV